MFVILMYLTVLSIVLQVMDRLRECMQLIKDSHSYFQSSTTTDNCPGCDQCSPRASIDNSTPVNCLVPTLLEYILDVSLSYIKIALGQFEGFISKCKRQVSSTIIESF